MAVTLKGYTANYLGLSTDAKPTEADDNAIFRELDTGKRYYFTGAAWAEIPSSGGGGGGDVTSVNGKTGAVTLTASDVGAYTTAETDALLGDKQNKTLSASVKIGAVTESTVEGAIGEVAAIIPATAEVSNKLSTAADTAGEDITATANSEDIALTDAADARVHDLKIYGKTENGHSVGENGLTVTAESDDGAGNNLITLANQTLTSNGCTATVENGVVTITGKNTDTATFVLASYDASQIRSFNGCVLSGMPRTNIVDAKLFLEDNTSYEKYGRVSTRSDDDFAIISSENGGASKLYLRIYTTNVNVNLTVIPAIKQRQAKDLILTSALPLRRKMLTVDLGDIDWNYETITTYESGTTMSRFVSRSFVPNLYDPTPNNGSGDINSDNYLLATESCSSTYTANIAAGGHDPITDKTFIVSRRGRIYIIDNSYTDPAEFKAAVTGITLTYPSYCDEIDLADGVAITRLDSNGDVLATPVTTPLSDAEKAAFAEFRTFDSNTNVTATDNPFMTLNYVRNTDNGKALADVDNKSAVRMAMIAAPYDDTSTYAVGNYCTYGDRLWKCNTAIGTAEPFTVAHWTGTTVMEEIS